MRKIFNDFELQALAVRKTPDKAVKLFKRSLAVVMSSREIPPSPAPGSLGDPTLALGRE